MSLKKLFLIAAMVALVTPAVALADGITFVFFDGHMTLVQPATGGAVGTVGSNASDPSRLVYISRFSGTTLPGGSAASNANNGNLPPQIAPTFGSPLPVLANTFNFGSVAWTTGIASSAIIGPTSSSVTYAPGGAITILSNGSLLPVSTLFSGSFSGPTTLASANAPANPLCTTCHFWYILSGAVSGTVDPALLTLLGLNNNSPSNGLLFSFMLGFDGPTDTVGQVEGGNISVVVVPEPGTLALFGTGLIGVAGFIRRRIKA
jgi:hypothetical protein